MDPGLELNDRLQPAFYGNVLSKVQICWLRTRHLEEGLHNLSEDAKRFPPVATALSQSRALEFVWPCLWYFCFTFLCVAFQLRLAWPHCIGVPINGTPLPVSPHLHRIELLVHCPYWDTLQIAGISACLNTFWNLKLSYLQIQAGMVIDSSSPGWDHWKQGLQSVTVAGSFLPTLP